MPNEIRPCTLPAHWKQTEPFDALSVSDVFRDEKIENRKKFDFRVTLWFGSPAVSSIESPYVQTQEEQDALFQEAITTIAEALDKPVLATEEVLKDLPKDAKIWVVNDEGDRKTYDKATYSRMGFDDMPIWEYTPYDCSVCEDDGYEYPSEVYTNSGCYLVADKNDPKTSEYLRQFTLDGVRINKEKETSHD